MQMQPGTSGSTTSGAISSPVTQSVMTAHAFPWTSNTRGGCPYRECHVLFHWLNIFSSLPHNVYGSCLLQEKGASQRCLQLRECPTCSDHKNKDDNLWKLAVFEVEIGVLPLSLSLLLSISISLYPSLLLSLSLSLSLSSLLREKGLATTTQH